MKEKDMFSYVIGDDISNEDKIRYVYSKLMNGNYTILPDSIAIGKVRKITLEGNLMEDGYERGFLYIEKNAGIKEHIHTNDIERYNVLIGTLSVKNEETKVNKCFIDESHNIDAVPDVTIIETLKITKEKLLELQKRDNKIL